MLQNDWNRLRAHYAALNPLILSQVKNEWAIDAYEWDNGMMRMTAIEQWLWSDIREQNAIFYPQYPVGRFFVDFANPVAKVAIECDGAAFHQDKAKDRARDDILNAMGWKVYRISGSDCRTESDIETGCISRAHRFVREVVEEHQLCRHHQVRTPEQNDWHHMGVLA